MYDRSDQINIRKKIFQHCQYKCNPFNLQIARGERYLNPGNMDMKLIEIGIELGNITLEHAKIEYGIYVVIKQGIS